MTWWPVHGHEYQKSCILVIVLWMLSLVLHFPQIMLSAETFSTPLNASENFGMTLPLIFAALYSFCTFSSCYTHTCRSYQPWWIMCCLKNPLKISLANQTTEDMLSESPRCKDMEADLHFPRFFGTAIVRRFPRSVVKKYQYFEWGSTLNLDGFKIVIFQYIICEPFRSRKEGLAKLDQNLWEIWRKFKCRRSMSYYTPCSKQNFSFTPSYYWPRSLLERHQLMKRLAKSMS